MSTLLGLGIGRDCGRGYAGGMTTSDGYVVEPLNLDRFGDLEEILGHGGIGGCWCMYWTIPTTALWRDGARGGSNAANRESLLAMLEADSSPGLICYIAGEPAAWCRVMRRTELPGLANSRYFKTDLGIANVWSLPCFVVRKDYRGKGLTAVLIRAAIEYVRQSGGGILEAYPWDTSEQKSAATVYTGVASTFGRLGFTVVQRRAPHKPMMRLLVDSARIEE